MKKTIRNSDFKKVKMVYGNKLHTHYVSHEEHYEPTDDDGDFAEPLTFLVCHLVENQKVRKGALKGVKSKLIVLKQTVLPVKD